VPRVDRRAEVSWNGNLAQEAFDEAVRAADEGCPFSRLIAAGAKVTIDARLEA